MSEASFDDPRIDVALDFREDTPKGKDPDSHSPKLREYHRWLWSKPLPSGVVFELRVKGAYLYHTSGLGEFVLSSDAVIPTFIRESRIAHVIAEISQEEREAFLRLGYTIGGMMIFPANKVDGRMTINGARGCNPRIKDRFDLTVECIRRHYAGEPSPLTATLARYSEFFRLFGDFRGYVEFFLLQDLVTEDSSMVRFFTPFEDFLLWPSPKSLEEYVTYRKHAEAFLRARNLRILASTARSTRALS
jgi:hypothetical protein